MSTQRVSQKGIELIKSFEGCRLKAYKCPSGVWTIGYGHTSSAGEPKVYEGMAISQDEAEEIFERDLSVYEEDVVRLFDIYMPQSIFDMAVSFHYNTGEIHRATWALQFYSNRNLLCSLEKEKISSFLNDVEQDFLIWNKSNGKVLKGLVNRRRKEWDYMKDGVNSNVFYMNEKNREFNGRNYIVFLFILLSVVVLFGLLFG